MSIPGGELCDRKRVNATTEAWSEFDGGVVTLYGLRFEPLGITAGPDGNIWMVFSGGIAVVAP